MVQVPEKTLISPVGWQRFVNIEAAVVGDKAFVVKLIHQIGNIAEFLTLHHNECAKHGSCRIAFETGLFLLLFRPGQIQMEEQDIIKGSLWLRYEQADALYYVKSADGN